MPSEFKALCGLGLDAECRMSGTGKVNAARCATELILEKRPDFIINSGLAGALSGELAPGDIVIGTRTAYHDVWSGEGNLPGQVQGEPLCFSADPVLLEHAVRALDHCAALRNGEGLNRVHYGLIATGDQFFISPDEDRRILGLYPDALASDMEAAAVAQVCRHYGIPFLCMRTISDTHGSAEEQAATYSLSVKELIAENLEFLKYFFADF